MSHAMQSIVTPVADLAAATATYRTLLDINPHVEGPYYVGFNVNGLEIGLVPNGNPGQATSPVAYWGVANIPAMLEALVATGASVTQPPTEVSEGVTVAIAADADGNPIGLIHTA